MRGGMIKQWSSLPRAMSAVGLCAAVLLLAAIAVHAQEKPKITEPTLKTNGSPPMPPPSTIAPKAATPAPVEANATTNAAEDKATYTFKFEAPNSVSAPLDLYSQLTGRNVIQSPAIAAVGNISIDVKTPLTKAEAILALESVLYAYGVSLTPMGDKFVKASPNANIASEGVGLAGEGAAMAEGDRVTAQVVPLHYLDVADGTIIASLQQFIHPQGGKLVPLTRSNSILVIDTSLIIKRLQEILERLDQPVENRVQTYFFPLKNAEVAKVSATLQALITGSQPAGGRPAVVQPRPPGTAAGPTEESIVVGKVTIQADDRTNTLIILSRPSNYDFLKELIDALDTKTDPEVKFKSFKLEHGKAEDLADLILSLTGSGSQPTIQRNASTRPTNRLGGNTLGGSNFSGSPSYNRNQPSNQQPQPQLPLIASRPTTGTTTPGTPGSPLVSTPDYVLSARARVIPDPRQGSILVLGTAQDVDLVERILKEIDFSGPQVMIESVVVEVTLDNSTQFGVNLLQRQFQKNGINGAGASLPNGTTSNLFLKPASLIDPSKFAGLGLGSGLTYFAQLNGLDLDVAVQALASSDNFKVLQTPIIQSSQNEAAHIFVGETRPIVTGTQTGLGTINSTAGIVSQIQQYDIGVTLDILPNITPGGQVQLEVSQAVEDISGSVTIDGNAQPIVSRRELNSIVSVQDNGVVVLGGLIRKDKTKNESKVPVLGDIPLLGHLFKQTKWEDKRIELIILIHPTVLPTPEIAQRQAQKMREKFKGLDNIPKDTLSPLPKEPQPEQKKPWYAPFQPPKEKS